MAARAVATCRCQQRVRGSDHLSKRCGTAARESTPSLSCAGFAIPPVRLLPLMAHKAARSWRPPCALQLSQRSVYSSAPYTIRI